MMSLRVAIALLRRFAHGRGSVPVERRDASFDLGPEVAQEALHRPRRALPEGTDGMSLVLLGAYLQRAAPPDGRAPLLPARHPPPHPAAALAARRALAAALVLEI